MCHRLGHLQPFFPKHIALSESAQFGMAGGEKGTGLHRGQNGLPETFMALCTVEGGGGLPEAIDGPQIVALGPVGGAKDWFASACRTTSLSAIASLRARWAAAMDWS